MTELIEPDRGSVEPVRRRGVEWGDPAIPARAAGVLVAPALGVGPFAVAVWRHYGTLAPGAFPLSDDPGVIAAEGRS